jgi:signal peptidase II
MKRWLKVLLFCLSSLTLMSWDRVTKDLAKEHLMNKAPAYYFHHIIILEYVENTGAALSFGSNLSSTVSLWLLSILPLVCLIALFIFVVRKSATLSIVKMGGFALIVAGGMGNIIDRLLYHRHVTDFMNIGIGNVRTGIFNFADVFVTGGVILLFFVYGTKQHLIISSGTQS